MSASPGTPLPDLDAFADLVCALLDGSITRTDHALVDRALTTSAPHRAVYRDLAAIDSLIAWDHRWPNATAANPKPDAERQRSVGVPASISESRSSIFNSRLLLIAAALLLTAAAVAIYFMAATPADDPIDTFPIATLIDADTNVIVGQDIAHPGADYNAGDYSIESGTADFMLTNRVTVRLAGRTSLTLHSDMAATIAHGTAVFDCPPGVRGYTVHLPDGSRVIDLGTRFCVVTDDDLRSRVFTLEGTVRLETPRGDTFVLDAGSGRATGPAGSQDIDPAFAQWLAARDAIARDPDLAFQTPGPFTPAGINPGDPVLRLGDGSTPHALRWDHGRWPDTLALRYDGQDSHVRFGFPGTYDQLTFAAWVNLESTDHMLQSIVAGDSAAGVALHVTRDGSMQFALMGLHGQNIPGVFDAAHLNRWVHIVVVADQSERVVRVYRDGEPLATLHTADRVSMRLESARVGSWDPKDYPLADRVRTLHGRVDDLFILTRAVTDEAVRSWYRVGLNTGTLDNTSTRPGPVVPDGHSGSGDQEPPQQEH